METPRDVPQALPEILPSPPEIPDPPRDPPTLPRNPLDLPSPPSGTPKPHRDPQRRPKETSQEPPRGYLWGQGGRQDIDPGLCVQRQHRARCRGWEHCPQQLGTPRGGTAVLTCGVRGPGRSPLPWRSGDSEALPAGDSPPERGERLRSTTGTGKCPSRGSTSLECPRSPGDGEVGTARRPPRPPPRPSPAGGVSGRWAARARGPEGPRFSRAARSLEMLSLRSRGSSRECMVPGWALRGTPGGHRSAGGHRCHPEHRPSSAP